MSALGQAVSQLLERDDGGRRVAVHVEDACLVRLAVHGHLKDVERNLLDRRLIAVESITESSPGGRVLVPKKKVE